MSEQLHNSGNGGYEKSDAKIGTLAWLAASVALLVLFSMTGIAIMWRVMAYGTHYTGELAGSPLAPLRPLPPSPRLQTTPGGDLGDAREQENMILGSYAWVEKDKGV